VRNADFDILNVLETVTDINMKVSNDEINEVCDKYDDVKIL